MDNSEEINPAEYSLMDQQNSQDSVDSVSTASLGSRVDDLAQQMGVLVNMFTEYIAVMKEQQPAKHASSSATNQAISVLTHHRK